MPVTQFKFLFVVPFILLAVVEIHGDCSSSCSSQCQPLVSLCNDQCTNHAQACTNDCTDHCNNQCAGSASDCQQNCLSNCEQANCSSSECPSACSLFSGVCNADCVTNCNNQQQSGALPNCTQCNTVCQQCVQIYQACFNLINNGFTHCLQTCDPYCCVGGSQNNCNNTCLGLCGETCISYYNTSSLQCGFFFQQCQGDCVNECQQLNGCVGNLNSCQQNCFTNVCGQSDENCQSQCNNQAVPALNDCQSLCESTVNCPMPNDVTCQSRCLLDCIGEGAVRSRFECIGGCIFQQSQCTANCEQQNNC